MYSSERTMSQNALLQCMKQCRNVFKWMIFSALCVFLCLFSVFPVSLASCWRVEIELRVVVVEGDWLPSAAPYRWLLRVLWLLGKRWLSCHQTGGMVRVDRTQTPSTQRCVRLIIILSCSVFCKIINII